jgi:predicted GNAT superfamily acetyltransferase
MNIRDATPKDLDSVFMINQKHVPQVGSVDKSWFENYLPKAYSFRVIETEFKIVGFMVAMLPSTDYQSENFLWFKANYPSFVYVDRIAIDSNYIGLGLGKKLYEDIESRMSSESTFLTCEVNLKPANPESLAFHKKLGFQELGTLDTKGGSVKVSLLGKHLT